MAGPAAMGHRQHPLRVEHEVRAQLPEVRLLREPGPPAQGRIGVPPDVGEAERVEQPASADVQGAVAAALRVGEPEVGMTESVGEAFDVLRRREGDVARH